MKGVIFMFHIDVYLKMKRRQKYIVWAALFLACLGISSGAVMYINGAHGLGLTWVILGGLVPILIIITTVKNLNSYYSKG